MTSIVDEVEPDAVVLDYEFVLAGMGVWSAVDFQRVGLFGLDPGGGIGWGHYGESIVENLELRMTPALICKRILVEI